MNFTLLGQSPISKAKQLPTGRHVAEPQAGDCPARLVGWPTTGTNVLFMFLFVLDGMI
jgi:hypothetical protein